MAHQREGIDFLTIEELACSLSTRLGKPVAIDAFEGQCGAGG